MTRDEFMQEFFKQHRENTSFALDLDSNSKKKKQIVDSLNSIPDEIIESITFITVEVYGLYPVIIANKIAIDISKDKVKIVIYDNHQMMYPPTASKRIHLEFPKILNIKNKKKLLEKFYQTYYNVL